MATDVKLDQIDGTFIVLEGRVVKAAASDFILDSANRRKGGGPLRRALVHNEGDGLTINFGGDYPAGVTVGGSLVILGGITYQAQTAQLGNSHTGTITISVDEEFSRLQAKITELSAKVAALEAKLK